MWRRSTLYTDVRSKAGDAGGQSFGDAVPPSFLQEKQTLGTEQFAALLLNEVLELVA